MQQDNSGSIYSIRNTSTGDSYIGSSATNPVHRAYSHFRALKRGDHFNPKFQSVWASSMLTDWAISFLEFGIPIERLSERESFWIRKMDPSLNRVKAVPERGNSPLFDAETIWALHGTGMKAKEIATEIGCSIAHVTRAIRRMVIAGAE